MGGCQNYGPFLGTLNIRCRIMIGIQTGTIILTTTHMALHFHACPAAMIKHTSPGSWHGPACPAGTGGKLKQ